MINHGFSGFASFSLPSVQRKVEYIHVMKYFVTLNSIDKNLIETMNENLKKLVDSILFTIF